MIESYYTVDALVPEKSIGFLVKRCGTLMTRAAERRFGGEPVSFTQWLVLASLSRHEHVSATALSGDTGYDMGALTRIVDGLESCGFVRRERSNRDRRAVEIALTAAGRRCLQGGKRVLVELLNELVTPYTRRELEALIGSMLRMLLRLQESEAHPVARPRGSPDRSRQRAGRRSGSRDAI